MNKRFLLGKFKIPLMFRSYYFVLSALFLIWILLFDVNDLISQFKSWRKLQRTTSEKFYYESKIEEVKKQRDELFGDKKALEKYAREEYIMKKPNEDVYLAEEQD